MRQINIRDLQHFLYCPHRWGLMEIDRAWAENYFVVRANLLHERVHDPGRSYTRRSARVFTSVPVFCDAEPYCLYGVADCLEARPCAEGISMDGVGERVSLCLVEYKPSAPKEGGFREEDALQVFAQKICVDSVFGGDCSAEIYHADVKRRVSLPFGERFGYYDELLRSTLSQMRAFLEAGKIPPMSPEQHCGGCSLRDICMPAKRRPAPLRRRIAQMMEEEA